MTHSSLITAYITLCPNIELLLQVEQRVSEAGMHIGLNRRGDHVSQLLGVLGGGREPDSAGEIVVHVGQLESEMLERILTEAG